MSIYKNGEISHLMKINIKAKRHNTVKKYFD